MSHERQARSHLPFPITPPTVVAGTPASHTHARTPGRRHCERRAVSARGGVARKSRHRGRSSLGWFWLMPGHVAPPRWWASNVTECRPEVPWGTAGERGLQAEAARFPAPPKGSLLEL